MKLKKIAEFRALHLEIENLLGKGYSYNTLVTHLRDDFDFNITLKTFRNYLYRVRKEKSLNKPLSTFSNLESSNLESSNLESSNLESSNLESSNLDSDEYPTMESIEALEESARQHLRKRSLIRR